MLHCTIIMEDTVLLVMEGRGDNDGFFEIHSQEMLGGETIKSTEKWTASDVAALLHAMWDEDSCLPMETVKDDRSVREQAIAQRERIESLLHNWGGARPIA